jgi:pimeloyl-ACP methyl ester carboxylesterase
VLFFPGGHCSAKCDCGWGLYTESGHAVVSFSRPGYGGTRVGPLSAAEFAPLVREVCEKRDISVIAAAVGVSFGGLQAVHVAEDQELGVPRLVLHSCAPSSLGYPDTRAEAIVGPVLFSPLLQGLVWRLVRRVVRSDSGLRTMMARLSKLPVDDWWEQLSAAGVLSSAGRPAGAVIRWPFRFSERCSAATASRACPTTARAAGRPLLSARARG